MLSRLKIPVDPYILMMLGMVALASLFPAHGQGTVVLRWVTGAAIAALFFLYGARLSPQAAFAGLKHWRLHIAVLLCTYALFPLLGLAAGVLVPVYLSPPLFAGLLFLCVLPSTVQSSIAFTSIAGGNVAGALCAASASNILGIFVTPLMVGLLLHAEAGFSFGVLRDIVLQLLLPFLLGQLLRPWIAGWVQRHKAVLNPLDRGSILLVIYAAFSAGVTAGIWQRLEIADLAVLFALSAALLAAMLVVTTQVSRRLLRFPVEDEIVLVFCGSKKSLASGLPMASVLFLDSQVGLVVLPLMLFHQMQLMVCAWLARRYANRALPAAEVARLAEAAEESELSAAPQTTAAPAPAPAAGRAG